MRTRHRPGAQARAHVPGDPGLDPDALCEADEPDRPGKAARHRPSPELRPGPRGYFGPGGGRASLVEAPPEWRATTVQVCGLWPWVVGSGTPMVGVPLGRHIFSRGTVCSDPIHWFSQARLIGNPSVLVLGKPGLGKSTLMCRMCLGLEAFGYSSVVLGDLKPDYAELVAAMGGHVVALGRGQGTLNPLDPGAAIAAAGRLTGRSKQELIADAHGRRLNLLAALIGLNRGSPLSDTEMAVLSCALGVLDEHHAPGEAVLSDLVAVLEEGPERLRRITLARNDEDRYRAAVDPIELSVIALGEGGLGETFAHRTSVRVDLSGPVCIDISGINEADEKLQAAVLLACWGEGFGAIAAQHALADAGLEPKRNYFVVLDELWRVLRAGKGLVDRVDALTRLNRQTGVGMALVTHTLADLEALPDPADQLKAMGFAERAGYIICGGLPAAEIPKLSRVVRFSGREEALITDWASPPSWDPETAKEAPPPGRGKFLLKVGGRPGIPVELAITETELALHDTNKRWGQR